MAIRVGLIGLNYGARVHIPTYKENSRYDLVAVCSRTPGRAEAVAREHRIPQHFTDVRAFLHSDIDLVSIATPPVTHAHLAAAAIVAGKHALVEVAFVGGSADATQRLTAVGATCVVFSVADARDRILARVCPDPDTGLVALPAQSIGVGPS